jgi:hypothetical protein
MDQEREDYDDREPAQRARRAHPAVWMAVAVLAGLLVYYFAACLAARIVAERFMVWN